MRWMQDLNKGDRVKVNSIDSIHRGIVVKKLRTTSKKRILIEIAEPKLEGIWFDSNANEIIETIEGFSKGHRYLCRPLKRDFD